MAVQPSRGSRESGSAAHDRAQRLIPNGAHTYSKDDAHFPPNAPRFIVEGNGAQVVDDAGYTWLDWGMGLRSVILGHGYRPVVEAATKAMERGTNFTRPSLLEGELAEVLCDLIPCAEMVKFGKNGSDATTAAVRLARAATGRKKILACDGSFHASDDWWLSTQPLSAGTVEQGTGIFPYNNLQFWYDFTRSDAYRDYAAVIMEPMAFEWPSMGYLVDIREWCTRTGTVLIFDECITGFRFGLGGAQAMFGVTPDLACFGKAIANGFSVSALVGKRELMQTPGVHLLSSTHGGETHGLAAALATIEAIEREDVPSYIEGIGNRLCKGLREAGYDVRGWPGSPNVQFPSDRRWPSRDYSRGPSSRPGVSTGDGSERMAFMTGMARAGILAPYWSPSLAHTEADVDRTIEAAAALR